LLIKDPISVDLFVKIKVKAAIHFKVKLNSCNYSYRKNLIKFSNRFVKQFTPFVPKKHPFVELMLLTNIHGYNYGSKFSIFHAV
jgi:hypothetical protein